MGNKTSFTSETGRAAGKKQLLPEVQAKKQQTQRINKLIKGELYDTIRTLLLANGGNTEDPYYKRFLEKYIKMGLEKPTSLAGERVANILLKENAIEALDELTDKALAKDIDFYQFRLQKRLFKRQKDVFNDFTSPRIAVMCSRRSGKTEDNGDIINRVAAIPDSPILYINLTFDNAIQQMYNRVLQEAERAELLISKESKSSGFIQYANGSTVSLKGNKDRSEADKLQGG